MAMIAYVIAWILAIILVLACLPIEAKARAEWNDDPEIEGKVLWAWGLFGLHFDQTRKAVLIVFGQVTNRRLEASEKPVDDASPDKPKRQRSKRRAGSLSARQILGEWRTWIDVLKSVMRALHLRGSVEGTIGLGDPADTALFATLLGAVPQLTGPHLQIELAPDYLDCTVDISANARMRVIPLEFLGVTLGQVLRAPVRRLLWSWWRN